MSTSRPSAHLADLTISQHQLQALGQRLGLLDQRMEQLEATLAVVAAQAAAARAAAERVEAVLSRLLDRFEER
jgi:hypothetical protein